MSVQTTVIGGEPRPVYDRVHLSEVFDGKEPSDLALSSREYYEKMVLMLTLEILSSVLIVKAKRVSLKAARKLHMTS